MSSPFRPDTSLASCLVLLLMAPVCSQASSSQDLVDALPADVRDNVQNSELILTSGDSALPEFAALAATVDSDGAIRLSTGLASEAALSGSTDFGAPDPGDTTEPPVPPGVADGLEDQLRFSIDFGPAPPPGPTLTVETQFLTSEYGRADAGNDFARIRLSWDGGENTILLGDVNSSFAAQNPRITTRLNVDGLENLVVDFIVGDGGDNGLQDSALLISRLSFSNDLLVTAGPGEPSPTGNYPQDVNLANGTFSFSKPLISVPGIRLPFSFSLAYNSNWDEQTTVGRKWTHNYLWQLGALTNDDNEIRMRKGGGLFEYFERSEDPGDPPNYFVPKYGPRDASLSRQDDNSWLYVTSTQLRYRFDADRRLESITEPNGNTIRFFYDNEARLERVEDTRRQEAYYHYDDASDKLVQVDYRSTAGELLSRARMEYDGDDLLRIVDPNGIVTEFSYDSNHNILTHEVRNDPAASPIRLLENTFNDAGKVTAQIRQTQGADSVTSFAYDPDASEGKQTIVTDPDQNQTTYIYDAEKSLLKRATNTRGASWSYQYNEDDLQTRVTEPRKFDPRANAFDETPTRRMDYDDRGNMTESVDPYLARVSMVYDLRNNLELRTDQASNATDYRYDGNNNLVGILFPLGEPEAEFEFDGRGLRTRTINRRGFEASFEYDAVTGELLRSIDPFGNATVYEYDALGRRVAMTTPTGATSSFVYDAGGRLLETIDPLQRSLTRRYDARGLLTEVDAPGGSGQRALTQYEFDARGLLLTETDPLGLSTAYDYDARGKLLQMTTPAGRVTTYEYDDLGLLAATTDAAFSRATADYDDLGRRVAFSFPENRNTFTFEYDLLDRLVARRDALGNTLSQDYDERGLVSTITNGRRQAIELEYDVAGRMTAMRLPERDIVHELDENGNIVRSTGDGPNPILREFDALDRLVSRSDEWGNTVGYAYDANGNLSLLTYSDGKQVRYGYDLVDRLVEVEDWDGNVTRYSYDDADNLSRVELPDGSVIEYRYDIANRMVGVTDTTGRGLEIYRNDRVLNDDGLVVSESVRLPLAPDVPDAVSNRQYGAVNQLQSVDGVAVEHDEDGNLVGASIDGRAMAFDYDSLNRLVAVNEDSYRYDADGLRSEARIDGRTVRYVNDPNAAMPRILEEHDADGNILARYVWGAGLISRQDGVTGRHLVYHFDTRGSTLALTDSSGLVTDRYAYAPYGKVLAQRGSTKNPFRYVGAHGVIADDNGLYFMRARYYEPNLRRFLTRDELANTTLVMPQTLNLYAYGRNNPISQVDPDGEFGFIGRALAGAAIGAAVQITVDLVTEGSVDWNGVAGAALEGAIVGALGPGGATWGAGWRTAYTIGGGALGGAAGAALGYALTPGDERGDFWGQVGTGAAFGAGGGLIDAKIAKRGDELLEGFARRQNKLIPQVNRIVGARKMIRRQQYVLKRTQKYSSSFGDAFDAGWNAQWGDFVLGGMSDDVALGVTKSLTLKGLGWSSGE